MTAPQLERAREQAHGADAAAGRADDRQGVAYLEDRTPIHLAGLLAGLLRDS